MQFAKYNTFGNTIPFTKHLLNGRDFLYHVGIFFQQKIDLESSGNQCNAFMKWFEITEYIIAPKYN